MGVSRRSRRTAPVQSEKIKAAAAPPPKEIVPNTALRDLGIFAALLCATLVAYLPALNGDLVWDDIMHVTQPDLQSWHGLWRIWFDLGATQQYYPLLHSAFWLEHRIWGDAVLGYHLTNVILHAACAFLVVLIVRRLALPGAWLAGFLFAVHPVCVEAVAWISEQKSTLSGVFCLAAALAYLHFDQTRRRTQYALALGLFVLALLCKSVTATLPAALLLIFWWQRGRIDWRRDVLPLSAWFAVAIPAGLFTAWVESNPKLIGAEGPQYALSFAQRLLLAGRVPWFYATKAILPTNLTFIYPRWVVDPAAWWQYLFPLALIALTVILLLLARRNRGPLAAFLLFCGTLFPVLGFLNVYPFRYSFVADHFQYLAILAILVPAAAGIVTLANRFAPGKLGALVLPLLLVATLGAATWRQSGDYRDYETLFRATMARNPGSALVHNNLGVILMSSGREAEAVSEFEAAVRLEPASADFHTNFGLALAQMPHRLQDAIAQYQTALRADPNFYSAHLNLGLALMQMPGRRDDAITEYQKAIAATEATLRDDPNFWQAHLNLGIAYGQIPGRESDSIHELQSALQMKPNSALAHYHLGNAFHKLGRLNDAVAEYEASLRIDPTVPEVHYELAYALAQIPGRVPDAIAACQKMLLLKPDDEPGRRLMTSLLEFQQTQAR